MCFCTSSEITINLRNSLDRQIKKKIPCVSRNKKSNNAKAEQKNNENMLRQRLEALQSGSIV